jgi:hypothetical protein
MKKKVGREGGKLSKYAWDHGDRCPFHLEIIQFPFLLTQAQ